MSSTGVEERRALTNAPAERTSFVGRAGELDRLRDLVRDHRLVTISGPGGIGKTRFALHYANAAIDAFPDGVWFVSLKEVNDATRIRAAAAAALGESPEDVSALFERLWKAHALLVFDNAEHLTSGLASFLEEVLEGAPDVRIIVTSREPLKLGEERVLRLGGIDDAVRLFIDRAYARALPNERAPEIEAIASICEKLQGIPLAIELAAARAASIPADELGDSLDGIVAGDALRETVAWSYDLLTPDECRCFDALGLFGGPFSWKAVEAIACEEGQSALPLLEALVNKSLVAMSESGGRVQYYLLEVVREYAVRQLRASRAFPDLVARFVDYYLAYVAAFTSPGNDGSTATDQLNAEWPNVERALREALDGAASSEAACEAIAKLWPLWLATGRTREGLYWIDRALSANERSDVEQVALLEAASRLASSTQDYPALEPLAERLAAAREQLGDPKATGDALLMFATAKHNLGEYDEGQRLYQRALEQYEAAGSRRGVALVLGTLGTIIEQRTIADPNDFDRARNLLVQSLEIFRQEGAAFPSAQILENLGILCMRTGELDQALTYAREALALYKEQGDDEFGAVAYISVAEVHLESGRPDHALSEILAGRRALGDRARGTFVAYYAESAFKAAVDMGAFETAARLYGFAYQYRKVLRTPLQPGEQAAFDARCNVLRESIDAQRLERCIDEGTAYDLNAVDARVASLIDTPWPNGRSVAREPKPPAAITIHRKRLTLRIEEASAFPAVFLTASGAWGKSTAIEHYLHDKQLSATLLSLTMPAALDSIPTDYSGTILVEGLHRAGEDEVRELLDLVRHSVGRIQWFLLSRQKGQAPIGACIAYGLAGKALDERDLAFTADEVREYGHLLDAKLSQQDSERIVHFTSGWPLAVNLALRAERSGIAMAPADRHAYVERETASLVSLYFREELFAPLDPDDRHLLLVAGAMPGDVRVEVLRQLFPSAEQSLSALRDRLPIEALDEAAYRLSPLFKQFLRSEFEAPAKRTQNGIELADAYLRVGDAVSAVRILLDVNEYERAVELLTEHSETWDNGDWPELLEAFVARLPAQLLQGHPAVSLASAAIAVRHNQLDRALRLFDAAAATAGPRLQLRVACARAALCIGIGEPANVADLEEALARAVDWPEMELRVRALLCCAYLGQGRKGFAAPLLQSITQSLDRLVAGEENSDILYWTALATFRLDDYESARRLSERCLQGHRLHQPWIVQAQANDLLSRISARTGAPFEETFGYAEAATALARRLNNSRFLATYVERQCSLLFCNADPALLEAVMNERDVHGSELFTVYSTIFRFINRLREAEDADSSAKATSSYAAAMPLVRGLYEERAFGREDAILGACVVLTGALANDPSIKEIVDKVLRSDEHRAQPAIEPMRLAALAAETFLGEHRSLAELEPVLDARNDGPTTEAVRAVVRSAVYAVRSKMPLSLESLADPLNALKTEGNGTIALLLAGLVRKSATLTATGVALSKTEIAILRQLAESLTAAEIAAARHSSINTIQTHMKNLYRKLGVNSAAAAINRGRTLGLI